MENMEGMETISWEEKWAIGNKLIDSQHKELVNLLNKLIYYCAFDQMNSAIPAALSFLINYTITHFNDEEALQLRCGFPYYNEHKQMHENLKITVDKLTAKYAKSGSTMSLKKDLYSVLAAWLINHIEHEDKKIGDYIASSNKKNKKKT